MRRTVRILVAAAVVGVGLLASAGPVSAAGRITKSGSVITYAAGAGAENDVTITVAADFVISDAGTHSTPAAAARRWTQTR